MFFELLKLAFSIQGDRIGLFPGVYLRPQFDLSVGGPILGVGELGPAILGFGLLEEGPCPVGIDLGFLVPEEAAARLSYPILVIHGTADTRIPTEHGERVYAAAPAGSEIWLVPDVDHVEAFEEHPDEYVDRLTEYFEERLDVPVGVSSGP